MAPKVNIYNAFTGISTVEKSTITNFLSEHDVDANRQGIHDAIEYAVKLKPSFGGFVLTVQQDEKIIGALVANRTGMEGYNPTHIIVYITLHPKYDKHEDVVRQLIHKAIDHADGDIALHVKPGNPALQLYQKIGFQDQYVELRFNKKTISAVA